jgi:endonuclease/exonuclease/phosphatase family metal-dependent hydrolase
MHYGTPPRYIAEGLIRLRERIAEADIPPSKLDESLNIATWNIREFGKKPRLDASIYFIAEILNQFDLIALTELRDNLGDLKRVMDLLGREWDVVFSDFIEDPGGNKERIAYLFDTRMVAFTGLAAEADPPRAKNKVTREYEAKFGWWRAPYMASFRAGNFDFVALTAHIRWGKKILDRVEALAELRDWVARRLGQDFAVDKDFIVMGDFNVPDRDHAAYDALTGGGTVLQLPDGLLNVRGTNLSRENTYDQILHSPTELNRFSGEGGVVDFYQDAWRPLYPNSRHRPASDRRFTYELSDHLPLWLQVNTDIMDDRLQIMAGRRRPPRRRRG